MEYAIVATGGKQYRVRPGDTIDVEKLTGEVGDAIELEDVLLTSADGKVQVGAPHVSGARVVAQIADHGRSPKVTVFRYHNKTRHRVKRGHRQPFTSLLIKGILSGGADAIGREK
ncbi:MAG: 50S ribosomal protein L21 [Chloroflexi bacterium]|nr:50S ribosomal protein L21 [Chloroflexota bacterium]